MKNKNLSFQLSIYLLIAGTILPVLIIIIGYTYVRDSVYESYCYRLQYDVQDVLDNVQSSMNEAVRFSENLEMEYIQGRQFKNSRKFIEIAFKVQSNLVAIGMETTQDHNHSQLNSDFILYRSKGNVKFDTGKFRSNDIEMNKWIKQMHYASSPKWSVPFYDPEIGSRVITYARPFDYRKNGKSIHATIFCSVSLDSTLENLSQQILTKSGFPVLINEQNRIVYHPDSTQTGKDAGSLTSCFGDSSRFNIRKLLQKRVAGYQIIHPIFLKHIAAVVIYWPVKYSNWFVYTIIPESLLLSELKRKTLALILLVFFVGSITAAVTIYLSIRLVSPISVLANNSRKIMEEIGFDPVLNSVNPSAANLDDSDTGWRLNGTNPVSHLNDFEVLSQNMERMKGNLVIYRKNTIQTSRDKVEMDRELKLAKEIEMSMVPTKFPLFPGRNDFDCFGRLIPAKIVGGDLFDIFLLDENQLFISICDTLGKGIPAAMFSVITRTFIRSIANPITRPGRMMESLNDGLNLGLESDMFATVLMGKLNLITGEFVYCNAGHPHPIILRNDNKEEVLTQSHGIPVGVKRSLQFSESRTILAPGESIITFTDGLTEEYDEKGEFFGVDRLIAAIKPLHLLSSQSIVNKTLDALKHFRGRAVVHDDTTLVAIKFTPQLN